LTEQEFASGHCCYLCSRNEARPVKCWSERVWLKNAAKCPEAKRDASPRPRLPTADSQFRIRILPRAGIVQPCQLGRGMLRVPSPAQLRLKVCTQCSSTAVIRPSFFGLF
jgi:hypothetical protein